MLLILESHSWSYPKPKWTRLPLPPRIRKQTSVLAAARLHDYEIGDGASGWLSWASNFSSGHDVTVRGLKPHIGLCADSSEPGACFGFCVSLPLSLSDLPLLTLSLSK